MYIAHRHHKRYGFRLVSRRRQSQYDNHWSVVWTILGTYAMAGASVFDQHRITNDLRR